MLVRCDNCHESGECQDCEGFGDADCPTCEGSGACDECHGDGHIECDDA
jgi:hypothetical protein